MLDPDRLLRLSQMARESAAENERQRRLPDPLVGEMTACGIFRYLVPATHGGDEGQLSTLFEALTALGRSCPSSAWVASLMASHSVIAAWFPRSAQDAVWGDGPNARIGSSLAPMGRLEETAQGLRLSGCWSFSSGLDHADWLLLGAHLEGRSVLALVPASVSVIVDDWKVAGLAASGSKSLAIEGCLVSLDHLLDMALVESGTTPGASGHEAPLYHIPWRPLFSYAFLPPVLGAAQEALEVSRAYFRERRSAFTGAAYKARTLAWNAISRATADVETAEALIREDLTALEKAGGEAGRSLTLRASFRPALVGKLCREAVERLFKAGGASVLYDAHPLQRAFRDIHAMTQHPALNYELACETYGRALLEDEPDA